MSAPLSPERCACEATLTTDPTAAEHKKWCTWQKPTAERIAEIKAGTGPVMLDGELEWLRGDAGRAELHISGAAAGAFPLSDDLPGWVAELGRKLGAVAAELDRTRVALAKSEHELTGACLSLWEEEQDTRRLRLALESAKRWRQTLRARVRELERPAVVLAALRARSDAAELEARAQAEGESRVAEPEATGPTYWRASHDSDGISFGQYTGRAAAMDHIYHLLAREESVPVAEIETRVIWRADDPHGPEDAETAWECWLSPAFGEDDEPTGYVVGPVTVAAAYDPDGDE